MAWNPSSPFMTVSDIPFPYHLGLILYCIIVSTLAFPQETIGLSSSFKANISAEGLQGKYPTFRLELLY
jgi:hypothetical protein